MSYNGYKNYETWCICLWIDNDEGMAQRWGDRARDLHKQDAKGWVTALADEMKDAFDNEAPELSGFWSDIFRSAFNEIDWVEVAQTRADIDTVTL